MNRMGRTPLQRLRSTKRRGDQQAPLNKSNPPADKAGGPRATRNRPARREDQLPCSNNSTRRASRMSRAFRQASVRETVL